MMHLGASRNRTSTLMMEMTMGAIMGTHTIITTTTTAKSTIAPTMNPGRGRLENVRFLHRPFRRVRLHAERAGRLAALVALLLPGRRVPDAEAHEPDRGRHG